MALLAGATAIAAKKGVDHLNEKERKKNENYPYPHYEGPYPGNDPAKCPGPGFEWNGKGSPETGKGKWVRGDKPNQESLYPDLNHPGPIGPHWDYEGPKFPGGVRIYPDGTWRPK